MKFDRMAVNFIISAKLPTQIVHLAVETDSYHQVPTIPPFFDLTESTSRSRARQHFHLGQFLSPQYLHPPNITQKNNPSTGNLSTASVKKEEVKHATPLPRPQDRPPDAQKFPMDQNSEQRNTSSTLSPQYLFPPNSAIFESGVTPRVVTQWSIISRFYFLRFSQCPPFIFSIV